MPFEFDETFPYADGDLSGKGGWSFITGSADWQVVGNKLQVPDGISAESIIEQNAASLSAWELTKSYTITMPVLFKNTHASFTIQFGDADNGNAWAVKLEGNGSVDEVTLTVTNPDAADTTTDHVSFAFNVAHTVLLTFDKNANALNVKIGGASIVTVNTGTSPTTTTPYINVIGGERDGTAAPLGLVTIGSIHIAETASSTPFNVFFSGQISGTISNVGVPSAILGSLQQK